MNVEDPPLKRVPAQQADLPRTPLDLDSRRRRPGDRFVRVVKEFNGEPCLRDPSYPYSIRDPWGYPLFDSSVANGVPDTPEVTVRIEFRRVFG